MIYFLKVKGYDSGLNELLSAQRFYYDKRVKRNRVFNPEKSKNDKLCEKFIGMCGSLKKSKLNTPIIIHYKFFCKDKKHDRMNIASAFDKSFQDALQHKKILNNDGWSDVAQCTFDFDIDRNHPRVLIAIEEVKDVQDQFDWKKHKEIINKL